MPTMLNSSEVQQNFGRAIEQLLVPPNRSPEAVAEGKRLAAQVQQKLTNNPDGSLEKSMGELRGRSWSS